jgi:hypothetical protein
MGGMVEGEGITMVVLYLYDHTQQDRYCQAYMWVGSDCYAKYVGI